MLAPIEVDRSTREFVGHLVADAAIDGVDIFCCDKTSGRGEIMDLYGHGMTRALKQGYLSARIHEVDPFTDVAVRETLGSASDGFELASDPQITRGESAERYWRFMDQQEIEIVGAATRRFLPGFYLVVGLHRLRGQGPRPEICQGRLGSQLGQVKDMFSAAILARLLQSGNGYGHLRRTMGFGMASGAGDMPSLSPRESEIAGLICAGKQNKEIAWLTGLSVHTIENHLKRIFRKFRIQNRAALVSRMQGMLH